MRVQEEMPNTRHLETCLLGLVLKQFDDLLVLFETQNSESKIQETQML